MTNILKVSLSDHPPGSVKKVFSAAVDRCQPTVARGRLGDQKVREISGGGRPPNSRRNINVANKIRTSIGSTPPSDPPLCTRYPDMIGYSERQGMRI